MGARGSEPRRTLSLYEVLLGGTAAQEVGAPSAKSAKQELALDSPATCETSIINLCMCVFP